MAADLLTGGGGGTAGWPWYWSLPGSWSWRLPGNNGRNWQLELEYNALPWNSMKAEVPRTTKIKTRSLTSGSDLSLPDTVYHSGTGLADTAVTAVAQS